MTAGTVTSAPAGNGFAVDSLPKHAELLTMWFSA